MELKDKKVLVTGVAGFIGFHLSRALMEEGARVIGVDIINNYYDVNLKNQRLELLKKNENFNFQKINICDKNSLNDIFEKENPEFVVNLAAQAGVRHSLKYPDDYIENNIQGFLNILEACRHFQVKHLVYASSSSVYGANTMMPFSTKQNVDHPVSLYGATKKANELMAHSYSHLFRIPTTGLRFFTVYGPWGRPDMAMFLFAKSILSGEPINVFNHGKMRRDFTYVDDIVKGILGVTKNIPAENPDWDSDHPDPESGRAPYKVYNIGNNKPIELMYLIEVLEKSLGKKAKFNMLPMQPGDVPATYADIENLVNDTGFRPDTPIEVGVERFVEWYLEFYGK